jgi:hypothetical protein
LLLAFLLAMVGDSNRRGVKHLLDEFWLEAQQLGIELPCDEPVTASAMTQARAKLSWEVLREVLWKLGDALPDGCRARGNATWRGRRVLAIDGQKLNVNRADELRDHFGVPDGCYCPQLLFSVLVDCCARMPLDFEIDSYRVGEREHMSRMLDSVVPGTILVLDRGYPSHEVLQELARLRIDFVVRVPKSSTFSAVVEFVDAGRRDGSTRISQLDSDGNEVAGIDVRITRFGHEDDETICVTSLSRKSYDLRAIEELYRLRWQAEEAFKAMSGSVLSQGLFRSATANGVRQELGAVALRYALSRLLAGALAAHTEDPNEQIQQKAAILTAARVMVVVVLEHDEGRAIHAVARALGRLLRHRYRARKRPSYPRRSYTPGPKWGPNGRRGA